MTKSVSILLGAGFSAPMGYPIGNTLNKLLVECDDSKIGFHTNGRLVVSTDGSKPKFGYKNNYGFQFDFCRDLIQHFNKVKGYFDYEEFYDYFNFEAKDDPAVEALFKSKSYGTETDINQMLFGIKNIYTQLVSYFLVDEEGNSWYDNAAHACGPTWPGYTGILNCFQKWGKEHIVNIHTLNHDLLFERLNISDWFQGELCDGFEELGSPYFGDLSVKSRHYKCRLQQYTGKYDKKFRLYKLHGSKDYGLYYKSNGGLLAPDQYLKTRFGVGFSNLYKEVVDEKGNLSYDQCWVNYHADFLTGTTSKIERYKEPLLFKELFQHFRINLNEAEKLIIIGYGGRDSEVNKMILENFDYKNKPSFIIDPYPGDAIKGLKNTISATLIEKQLENINPKELE
jgi:hypothetical protein